MNIIRRTIRFEKCKKTSVRVQKFSSNFPLGAFIIEYQPCNAISNYDTRTMCSAGQMCQTSLEVRRVVKKSTPFPFPVYGLGDRK